MMNRSRLALVLALVASGCMHGNSVQPSLDVRPVADAELGDGPATPPAHLAGINFAPTQGSSNAGAFLPGVYQFSYTDAQIAAAGATFNIMRLPINVATANDPASLEKLRSYVDQLGG